MNDAHAVRSLAAHATRLVVLREKMKHAKNCNSFSPIFHVFSGLFADESILAENGLEKRRTKRTNAVHIDDAANSRANRTERH